MSVPRPVPVGAVAYCLLVNVHTLPRGDHLVPRKTVRTYSAMKARRGSCLHKSHFRSSILNLDGQTHAYIRTSYFAMESADTRSYSTPHQHMTMLVESDRSTLKMLRQEAFYTSASYFEGRISFLTDSWWHTQVVL